MPIYNNLGDIKSNSISAMSKHIDYLDKLYNLYSMEYEKTNMWDCFTAIQKKEEKKDMKSKSIVELYFNNMKTAVKEKTSKTVNALTAADPIISAVQKKIDEIQKIINDNSQILACQSTSFDVEVGDLMSKETEASIEKAYTEKVKEVNRLNMLKNEILTMLTPCETYDEEMEVLFVYGIIDEDGKLVHPDSDVNGKTA